MRRIITFLGIRPMMTIYEFNGKHYEGRVFAEALRQFVNFDEMIVLTTSAAEQATFPVLAELGDERIHPKPIPVGQNASEMWQIFQTLIDLVHIGDSVIFDITHGLRSIPFFVFLAAAFLRSARQVTIDAIYYGALELGDQRANPPVPAPVLDLSEFIRLLEWMDATQQFVRSGNAQALATLLREAATAHPDTPQHMNQAAADLDRVSSALRLLLPDQAMSSSLSLQKTLSGTIDAFQFWVPPFAALSQQVLAVYLPLALENPRQTNNIVASLEREKLLIQWYLERDLLLQAIGLAREWLISWGVAHAGYPSLYLYKYRRPLEAAFQDVNSGEITPEEVDFHNGVHMSDFPELSESLRLYVEIGKVRNALLHAGKTSRNRPLQREIEIHDLCQQLDVLPLPASAR